MLGKARLRWRVWRRRREAEKERQRRAAKQAREAAAKRAGIIREMEIARRNGDTRNYHRLKKQIKRLHAKATHGRKEARIACARRRHGWQRQKWWAKRKTYLRGKLRKAREQKHPTPEPWMANGHEYDNLSRRARELLAIAVVRYDQYCTSITRNWGTGSYHERVPTLGFDSAGPRMVEFQRDLRNGKIDGFKLSDLLELFGPDNAACANDGKPFTLVDGSGLENLHDNHVHSFVYP